MIRIDIFEYCITLPLKPYNNTIVKGITNCNSTILKDPLFDESYISIIKGAYNSNTLLRYTSAQFYNILIDIGATKYSIAGYSQF